MSTNLVLAVTGAATGFGALTARHLARNGHTVYAGLRTLSPEYTSSITAFAREHNADLRFVEQDVCSDPSVTASIAQILRETGGKLDGIVHNAGHMSFGPAEAFTPEQLAAQYDVNVLGTQRVTRAVLPHFREKRRGLLLWVGSSSVHGAVPPYLAPYFAAKAGMDALAASYALETSRFGVENTIVVPGAFSKGTEHFNSAMQPGDAGVVQQYSEKGSPYEGFAEQLGKEMPKFEPEESDPAAVADRIAEVVAMKHGTRPYRTHVDFRDEGAEEVSMVRDKFRRDALKAMGMEDLLKVKM